MTPPVSISKPQRMGPPTAVRRAACGGKGFPSLYFRRLPSSQSRSRVDLKFPPRKSMSSGNRQVRSVEVIAPCPPSRFLAAPGVCQWLEDADHAAARRSRFNAEMGPRRSRARRLGRAITRWAGIPAFAGAAPALISASVATDSPSGAVFPRHDHERESACCFRHGPARENPLSCAGRRRVCP